MACEAVDYVFGLPVTGCRTDPVSAVGVADAVFAPTAPLKRLGLACAMPRPVMQKSWDAIWAGAWLRAH
jgi:hypothetical protein